MSPSLQVRLPGPPLLQPLPGLLLSSPQSDRQGQMSGAQPSHPECQIHCSIHQGGDRKQQGQRGLEVCGDGP